MRTKVNWRPTDRSEDVFGAYGPLSAEATGGAALLISFTFHRKASFIKNGLGSNLTVRLHK